MLTAVRGGGAKYSRISTLPYICPMKPCSRFYPAGRLRVISLVSWFPRSVPTTEYTACLRFLAERSANIPLRHLVTSGDAKLHVKQYTQQPRLPDPLSGRTDPVGIKAQWAGDASLTCRRLSSPTYNTPDYLSRVDENFKSRGGKG